MTTERDGAWYERSGVDVAIVVAVPVVHALVIEFTTYGDILGNVALDRRLALYELTAQAAALLLAVASTGLGLYMRSSGRRMRRIRRKAGVSGLRVWVSVEVSLLLLVLVSMVALVVDPEPGQAGPTWIRFVYEGTFALVGWRFGVMMVAYRRQLETVLRDEVAEFEREERSRLEQQLPPTRSHN